MRHFNSGAVVLCSLVFLLATISGWSTDVCQAAELPGIPLELAKNEPPCNPFLANSHWPMCHRNTYNQASSPYPGPASPEKAQPSFVEGHPCPITLAVSGAYPNGKQVVWGVTTRDIFKLDLSGSQIDFFARKNRDSEKKNAISGAYSLVDSDGTFFAPHGNKLEAYRDSIKDDPSSPIKLWKSFELPTAEDDLIVGINLTYDGRLILATQSGLIVALSRDLADPAYLQLPVSSPISNSIAIDETGGVFVVKSDTVVRIQWDADKAGDERLALQWAVPYKSVDEKMKGRLGAGSGTSPSLMGTGDQDKFIVIGDGQKQMHLVLIWRGDIPEDWEGLPGLDRRIAAEVPVTFGHDDEPKSTTEQSLTVRGYGVAAVSNLYGHIPPFRKRLAKRVFGNETFRTIYRSNYESVAPYGAEKFVWNPKTRRMTSSWANSSISMPNGIPTMSEATGLFYCIGQRETNWTLEAVDWYTGESVFHQRLSRHFRYNSFYAATQIGPSSSIITGMYGGVMKFADHPVNLPPESATDRLASPISLKKKVD